MKEEPSKPGNPAGAKTPASITPDEIRTLTDHFLDPLVITAKQYKIIRDFGQKANAGDEKLLAALYIIAMNSTSFLNRVKCEALKKIAQNADVWPVQSSSNAWRQKRNKEFLERIALGTNHTQMIKVYKRFTRAVVVATILYDQILTMRRRDSEGQSFILHSGESKMLSTEILRAAEKLPPYSSDKATFEAWWTVAKCLLDIYAGGKPEKLELLRPSNYRRSAEKWVHNHSGNTARLPKDSDKYKSAVQSRMRAEITTKIMNAFKRVATLTPAQCHRMAKDRRGLEWLAYIVEKVPLAFQADIPYLDPAAFDGPSKEEDD